jgi:rhodanese-related sulfurtransferase
MQRLIEFIGRHPFLVTAAVLAAALVIANELRIRLLAIAALSTMQAVRLMNQGALLIDLRGKEAFDSGHIGDARNIPAAQLESQIDALKKWREKSVITYCDTGGEAAAAARKLSKLGFSKVFSLGGGVQGWVKENLPLARTSPGGKSGAK